MNKYIFRQPWNSSVSREQGGEVIIDLDSTVFQRTSERVEENKEEWFSILTSALIIVLHKFRPVQSHRIVSLINFEKYQEEQGFVAMEFSLSEEHMLDTFIDKVRSVMNESFEINLTTDKATQEQRSEALSNVLVCSNELCEKLKDVDQWGLIIQLVTTPKLQIKISSNGEFDMAFLKLLGKYMTRVLSKFDNLDRTINSIELIENAEKGILWKNNDRTKEEAVFKPIAQIIEENANESPNQPALIYDKNEITYQELNDEANKLANYLANEAGVVSGDSVAVLSDKSSDWYISIFAIFKIGAVYIPIDFQYPADRVKHIIDITKPKIILFNTNYFALLADFVEIPMFSLNLQRASLKSATGFVSTNIDPEQAAYIIFTSGSTGEPKGVVIKHRGLSNMIISQHEYFDTGVQDRVLQFASAGFDVSIYEVLLAFTSGAALVPIDRETMNDTEKYFKFLERFKISIAAIPPTFLNILNVDRLPNLKAIYTGGEQTHTQVIDKIVAKDIKFINQYGLTETTCTSLIYEFSKDSEISNGIPIGKPIPGVSVFILDENLEICPKGISGEIYIGGTGASTKYLNNKELNDERYVPNPIDSNNVLFKTGDTAVQMPDGNLEFIGRIDNQVKIRQHRVELGEVEEQLKCFELITDAVVLVSEGKNGNKLDAYFTAIENLDLKIIKQFLAQKLPIYMIPATFRQLVKMPLTVNGKVDKTKLKDLKVEILKDNTDHIAPRNELESDLSNIWRDILSLDLLGINDNFFDVGGDSLKMITIYELISEKYTSEILISDLFDHPTIMELAKLIDSKTNSDQDNFKYDVIDL